MKLTPANPVPSERDQDIYRAVKISLLRQADVAALFDICQARVSQVCDKVRKWLARQPARDITPGEQDFIAAQETRLRLEQKMQLAKEVFETSCQQEEHEKVRRTKRRDCEEVVVQETIFRPGRPNHHMFREMVGLEEQHFAACQREHALQAGLAAARQKSRWWREERLAQAAMKLCQQIVIAYPTAQARGLELAPLPKFEYQSLQSRLRAQLAQSDLETEQRLATYLPREWAVLVRQLELEEPEEAAAEQPAEAQDRGAIVAEELVKCLREDRVCDADSQPSAVEVHDSTDKTDKEQDESDTRVTADVEPASAVRVEVADRTDMTDKVDGEPNLVGSRAPRNADTAIQSTFSRVDNPGDREKAHEQVPPEQGCLGPDC